MYTIMFGEDQFGAECIILCVPVATLADFLFYFTMSFQSNLEKLYTMNKSNFEGSLMPWLLSIAAIFAIGALIDRLLGIKKLDLEPPFLPSKIPYFGHAIGIVRKGVPYYESLT